MITIKQLTPDYADKILALETHCGLKLPSYYPYDKEALDEYIFKNKDGKAYGAFDGDKLIGWAGYSCREKEDGTDKGVYEMCGLAIDPEYRRKGIGKKLFEARMTDLLKKKGISKIYATNYPKNIPILLLYLSNGFVIDDFKKDIYGPGAHRVFVVYERLA